MRADKATVKIEYEVEIEDKMQNGPFQITRDKGKNAPLYSKTGHWSDKENIKYYAFLRRYQEKFSQKQMRREWKVFKTLSEFIKTRNPNQCRSHHHKMQKDFSNIEQTLQSLRHKIPDIQKKSERYEQLLNQITFGSSNNMSQYKPTEIPIHQNKKHVQKNEYGQSLMIKKQNQDNMRTGLTYDDNEQKNKIPDKQLSSYMKMENFAEYNYTYGMGANEYSYFPNNYNTFKRQQKFQECHQYFLRWWTKLTSLIQEEEMQQKYSINRY